MRVKMFVLAAAILIAWTCPALAQEPVPPDPGDAPPQQQEKKLTQEQDIDKLIGELTSDDSSLRDRAQKRLIEIGLPAAEAVEKLVDSEKMDIRARAKKILKALHYVTKADRVKILKEIDLCLWGCEPKPVDEETKKLIEELSSDDWQTREDALKKLVEKGPPVLREVAKLLDSDDLDRKDRAEKIINAIREKHLKAFKKQLDESTDAVRQLESASYYLVELLSTKGDKAMEKIVARFLAEAAGMMMTEADLNKPGRFGPGGRSITISTVNGRKTVTVNGEQVKLLGGNPGAGKVLTAIASDKKADKELKEKAVKALAARGETGAVAGLFDLLGRVSGLLKVEVAKALRKLTGQDFGPTRSSTFEEVDQALENWKKWWDENKGKEKYRFSEAPAGQDDDSIVTGEMQKRIQELMKGLLDKENERRKDDMERQRKDEGK